MKGFIFATGVLLSAGIFAAGTPAAYAGTTYGYANTVLAPESTSGGYSTTGWLGQLGSNAGPAFSTPNTGQTGSGNYYLTPFEPAYDSTNLAKINAGATLVLAFNGFSASTLATVNNGFTLGIHAGVGIEDTTANSSNSYNGNGVAADPAATFNSRVSYLAIGDGTKWVWYAGETLNSSGTTVISTQWTASSTATPTLTNATSSGAALMTFNDPSAYYGVVSGDSSSPYYVAPDGGNNTVTPASGTPLSEPAQAFTGTLNAFNGENYSQVMATLSGSAGGDWFNLSTTGLPQVSEVAFVAPSGPNSMYIQAVVGVVPEPATLAMFLSGIALLPLLRRRRKFSLR